VEHAPFLVTKLKVQVLPCIICFVDGVGVDRIIGFEGLGNGDNFTTRDLEARLLRSGVLVRAKTTGADRLSQPMESSKEEHEDDDDDEWE
jgi:thioredoxin-like negative regulator of GroEL